ncbi:transcription factor bHLH140 [Pyrus x bretschneideri]|uniref:transcription factor bHLH140 n=1 Tax=Pyrus x bretschneideri TaxID=225117 RepID=UPI002030999B|nr:transcription factor bHLH140 [Pyrus x bretschneideri]XP_048430800.1 transcription factor bHLH140 [Pyrus x bretschneideri]
MDMDIDETAKGEEKQGKSVVVILVGAPGSGKSTFCEHVMRSSSARPWLRVCQDTIKNGKAGTKAQCIESAMKALKDGKSVFIDRCNLEKEQRDEFVKLGGSTQVDVHAVVLDLPAKLCISRSVKRMGHEGNLQGGRAAAVVNRMLQKKELPKLSEGFARITCCQSESDVQSAVDAYSGLGPLDTLPSGYFGQKNTSAKVQLGIMRFLKKTDESALKSVPDSNTSRITEEKETSSKGTGSLSENSGKESKEGEQLFVGSVGGDVSLNYSPTLAFPSISTADFQFDIEKASDIIVEKVIEFVNKLGNARLVLVDLSHKSKILSLVRAKALEKNIDSNKFFTFVGDITRLHSGGGLHCNVIANAANWRLKPGGGGVNAAIFSAGGPSLELATKEQAQSLYPGSAVVVPLPSTSPLFSREGVTHVIHVVGPNMNPHRPNCLNYDYSKGCKVLREAYTSLFEGFATILRSQAKLPKGSIENLQAKLPESQEHSDGASRNHFTNSDQKTKREDPHKYERSKRSKAYQDDTEDSNTGKPNLSNKSGGSRTKSWGSWAQALYNTAMHPEKHKDAVLEISDDVVVLNDLYPKAKRHVLVVARCEGLDRLSDVHKEHLPLLRTMHEVGLKWVEKFLHDDSSLVFRLGYHLDPSMRQLHLHVISQDFDSTYLKNKKHWNSFNTAFFRDSMDVVEEVSSDGKAKLKEDDSMLSMELRCHRCRSAHPNIPRLKSHITNCRATFPSTLLQNGRLVHAPSNVSIGP